jgi:hypothetical protein
MTVTVTRKPGGITQLFNTDNGRVTYKCKAESAYMLIEAFGGIVKFNQKNAMATVTGHITSLEDSYQKEIQELENKLSAL